MLDQIYKSLINDNVELHKLTAMLTFWRNFLVKQLCNREAAIPINPSK